jgi:hypothetical protein
VPSKPLEEKDIMNNLRLDNPDFVFEDWDFCTDSTSLNIAVQKWVTDAFRNSILNPDEGVLPPWVEFDEKGDCRIQVFFFEIEMSVSLDALVDYHLWTHSFRDGRVDAIPVTTLADALQRAADKLKKAIEHE